jgi:hypothetical protein
VRRGRPFGQIEVKVKSRNYWITHSSADDKDYRNV